MNAHDIATPPSIHGPVQALHSDGFVASPNGVGQSSQSAGYQGSPTSSSDSPTKQRRHRNKPSLSCEACTVKKTKCDRGRPLCFACQKRRSECRYSHLADLIEESHLALGIDTPRKRPKAKKNDDDGPGSESKPATPSTLRPTVSFEEHDDSKPAEATRSRSSTGSSPMLLSNVPFSHPTISNIFKAEHPFSNYWTHQGGLPEVIGVLPSKDQSDILVAKYFDVIDPVYPFLHRESFQKDYDAFWSLPLEEHRYVDGSLVALIFVMLAMGTQFVAIPSPDAKEQTAEFYVSASHQALRVINYLGRPSLRSMQCMVLIIYFLMNDNHASDAWAFAGILTRHAYALGLNRDPSVTAPNAHPFEKQQRRKLWQAVLFQDTFFSIILKLPPTATHSDCRVEDLLPELDSSQMIDSTTDISYIASMWYLANIVQPTICTPRSLDLPISQSAMERTRLLSEYSRIYDSLPGPFRTFNEASICELATRSKRLARQTLFLTSNYFHCLMLIYVDEHGDMELDVYGTLDAAHEAISSFFLLHKLFEDEARVWYHFQHRAFSEALIIAELVKNKGAMLATDTKRMRAKDDLIRMIGILGVMSEHDVVARTRVSVLSKYL
ncbi:MAG: hypothetical protein Q9217_001300 [Psora testacea]